MPESREPTRGIQQAKIMARARDLYDGNDLQQNTKYDVGPILSPANYGTPSWPNQAQHPTGGRGGAHVTNGLTPAACPLLPETGASRNLPPFASTRSARLVWSSVEERKSRNEPNERTNAERKDRNNTEETGRSQKPRYKKIRVVGHTAVHRTLFSPPDEVILGSGYRKPHFQSLWRNRRAVQW